MNNERSAIPKILIVDDDPESIRLLDRCLSLAGYEVVSAANGRQALEVAAAEQPDAILLDVMMPEMDGVQTCRLLKQSQSLRSVPVIMVSAVDQEDGVVRGLEAGADDYIAKPFNARVLVARTGAAVNRYIMHRENARLLAEVQHSATTDSLTGVLNRRTFFEYFHRDIARATRHRLPLSCVILDLDFFKNVNDTYGHAAGDLVLRAVADVVRDHCREPDSLCRYGGEEFCVLLPHTDEQEAMSWAERTRARIAEMEVMFENKKICVAATFGVAERLDDVETPEQMINLADQALLAAKRSGRNCVVPYSALDDTLALQDYLGDSLSQPYDGVTARDVMASPIFCLPQDATLKQAALMLLQLRINSIPIVDDDGCLVGILSERDVIDIAAKTGNWRLPIHHKMTRKVVQFRENAPARTIHDFLCRNGIRRVVVADEEGRPTGVISRANLLRRLRNWQPSEMPADDTAPLKPDYQSFKQDVIDSAGALADQLHELQDTIRRDEGDFGSGVVDVVSKTQELATHLLTQSRAAVTRGVEAVPSVEPWVG